MDHIAMKQAMINALQHKVDQLQNDLNYHSIIIDDSRLIADSLAECLQMFLSGNCTQEDTEHAHEVLKIWRNSRVDYCEECAKHDDNKNSD